GEALSLIETLERYLDLGGDARAAAEQLFIHRSSLYGRLHRIEEVAGVDLHSGEDRLELHLGVRLWRLGGSRLDS
ncbi:MAG: helix-turn-helix domain-containing protein, partial [Actinobacteria bacterium]|nr:helix-turn-helix domain-containing protein [Actinomycetota bacterium]